MSEPQPAGVVLHEAASPLAFLNLRGAGADEAFQRGVRAVLGVAPPTAPSTWHRQGRAALYWLGPDEWLAEVPSDAAAVERQLRVTLRGRFAATDVSGAYAVFRLTGAAARKVLGKSCTYDVHPRHLPPGRCVQTPLAKANALIVADAGDAFMVIVRRSYAAYVRAWLADAASEYGFRTTSE